MIKMRYRFGPINLFGIVEDLRKYPLWYARIIIQTHYFRLQRFN